MWWPFIFRDEYDAIQCRCLGLEDDIAKLKERVGRLERLLVDAAQRTTNATLGGADLRKPANTWRSRGKQFTIESQKDPSTFPKEDDNVPKK